MDSLFTGVANAADSESISSALGGQISNLTSAGELLRRLVNEPPQELGQMVSSLGGVSLPEIEPLQDLIAAVGRIAELVPVEPGDLTGVLTEGFDGLGRTLETDLFRPLTRGLDAVRALDGLARNVGASGVDGGAGGGAAGAAAVAGGGAAGKAGEAGRAAELVAALGQIEGVLDALPAELTVESFLRWLLELLQKVPVELFPGRQVPVLTELQQQLETVLGWQELDGPGLAAHLESTVRSLAGFVGTVRQPAEQVGGEIETLTSQVPLAPLRTPMQAIEQGLRDLAAGGDPSTVDATITELGTRLADVGDALAGLRTEVLSGQTGALTRRLDDLPALLDARMREILAVLKPPRDFAAAGETASAAALWSEAEADEVVAGVERFFDGLRELVGALDLESIRGALQEVIDAAHSVVDELDSRVAELTTTVSLLFDEVDGFIDGLDVAAVTRAVEETLGELRESVTGEIRSLFEPVRTALASAIETLSTNAGAFSEEALTTVLEALRDLVGEVGDVLGNEEVTGAFAEVVEVLDTAVQALEELSFRPVTDVVIGKIDEVAGELRQIDVSQLPDLLRSALRAALGVLPTDLGPIVDALTEELDELIEAGPSELLTEVRGAPERLVEKVRELSPANLIGGRLSAPYQEFLGELDAFRPSRLLAPVEEALDEVAERLRALDPSRLLAPLATLHDDLLAAFDRLDPDVLLEPLSDQITALIDGVEARLPLEEVSGPIGAVTSAIEQVVAGGEALRAVADRLVALLAGLGSPETQVRTLVDPVLALVDEIPDTSSLAPAFAEVRAAFEAVRGTPLGETVLTPLAALEQRLADLDPGALHSAVVRARRDLAIAVGEMSESPARAQITGFLDGFDPLSSDFARPWSTLAAWRTELGASRQRLGESFSGWDLLYHGADGPFAEFLRDGVTTAQLRELLEEALESSFAGPLTLIFGVVERAAAVLSAIAEAAGGLLDDVQGRLETLLLLPAAAQAILDAVDGLFDTLRGFDLSFLADEVRDVFARVRSKLEALDPEIVRTAVQGAFEELIGSLNLGLVLPQEQIRELDGSYESILTTLRALDPEALIVEVVQPEFEEVIEPLLEVVASLSALIDALLDRLDGLDAELNLELNRTGDAFGRMVQAIPL